MSIYRDKVDTFDQVFNQIVNDLDSDSDCPNRSQEVQQESLKTEAPTLKEEDSFTALGLESPDLDDSIEILDDSLDLDEHPAKSTKRQQSKQADGPEEAGDQPPRGESSPEELSTGGSCRRSQRLRTRAKKKTPPKSRRARKKQKTPPSNKQQPAKQQPIIQQHDVIDIISSDDADDNDEPMVVHDSTPTKVATQTPTSAPCIRSCSQGDSSIRVTGGDSSLDDFPYNLKLLRFGAYEQYETTLHTKLSVALKDLIDECNRTGKVLLLTRKNEYEPLPLDGTPQSLNLDSGTILNAITALPQAKEQDSRRVKPAHSSATATKTKDPNVIHLKLQDGQRRHLKEYPINLRESLGRLRKAYADEFGHSLEDMKLCFDGDLCEDDDTPESLELEDGFVLDVMVAAR